MTIASHAGLIAMMAREIFHLHWMLSIRFDAFFSIPSDLGKAAGY
jgi:hypothetical protein